MIKFYSRIILPVFILIFSTNIYSMIDNRYLPLYRDMYTRYSDKRSLFGSNLFFLLAHEAFGADGDKEIRLPELNGRYDLVKVAKALEIIGNPNPLKAEWRSFAKIEMELDGKLEGQGYWLAFEKALSEHFSLGFSWYLLNVVSRQQFIIPESVKRELKLNKGTETELDADLRKANQELGITNSQFKKVGPSDLDLYLRFGTVRDYVYKFRRVDVGVNFGCLFPSSLNIELDNPASIPFGGNGHYGLYGLGEVNLELKEDLLVGLWFEVLKRLPKDQVRRIPINGEPTTYGAVIGKVRIDPGITVGFSPYAALTDIRDGFGFKIRYTLIYHAQDEWYDRRSDRAINTNICSNDFLDRTEWVNEYLTFTLMYDFTKAIKNRKFAPLVYLEWDRPSRVFFANQVSKTHRISFGLEFSF